MIIKGVNIAIGQKLCNNKNKVSPWWNDDCSNAIKNTKNVLTVLKIKKTQMTTYYLKSKSETTYVTKANKMERLYFFYQ